MPVHVALLRAINVGGTGTLPMTNLRAICEGLGFSDVATYIQSGNVLFRSDLKAEHAENLLDDALAQRFGKAPGVMIRSGAELAGLAADTPFPDAKPSYLMVHFLPGTVPDGSGLRGLQDRVESLRGAFTVTGATGSGTVVRATFPADGGAR